MQCQVCKKAQAKVHYTQIHENQVKKVDLCEACAKEKGINDPAAFALADLVLGLGAPQKLEESATAVGTELVCRNCGFTQADFKKTGRLGCSECYLTFAEGLEALLKGMHKGVQHKGKVPPEIQKILDIDARLGRLDVELKAAVAREDFETAARLRDEIKQTKLASGETVPQSAPAK
jgi:protein arginine kinase activator